MKIKTWNERCEEKHADGQCVTHSMIQARMQEEIDELRAALAGRDPAVSEAAQKLIEQGKAQSQAVNPVPIAYCVSIGGMYEFFRHKDSAAKERNQYEQSVAPDFDHEEPKPVGFIAEPVEVPGDLLARIDDARRNELMTRPVDILLIEFRRIIAALIGDGKS
jgi:hypothetical protein